MIYKLRLKLSAFFFRIGRDIHPDISKIKKQLLASQQDFSKMNIKINRNGDESVEVKI